MGRITDKTNDPTQAITRRQLLRGIVGSAGVVALAVAGCASPAQAPAPTAAAKATTAPAPAATTAPAAAATQAPAAAAGTPSTIKLGAMFSMSGQSAAVAKPQMFGARLAAQDVNAKGGIKFKGQQVNSSWSSATTRASRKSACSATANESRTTRSL